jgi:hypothetical protein
VSSARQTSQPTVVRQFGGCATDVTSGRP